MLAEAYQKGVNNLSATLKHMATGAAAVPVQHSEAALNKPVEEQSMNELGPKVPLKEPVKERTKDEPGLFWHAQLIPADCSDPKFVMADGTLKKRRPKPIIRTNEFFDNLTRVGNKWILRTLRGLNDWPGLDGLVVQSITGLVKNKLGRFKIKRFWDASMIGHKPCNPGDHGSVRVTLQAAPHSVSGWTADSPGYFWWLEHTRIDEAPMLFHGQKATDHFMQCGGRATRVHHFGHRYAKPRESTKDKVVYHCCVLVEWDHGEYTTMFELAWVNGVTGNAGKSNWQEVSPFFTPRSSFFAPRSSFLRSRPPLLTPRPAAGQRPASEQAADGAAAAP